MFLFPDPETDDLLLELLERLETKPQRQTLQTQLREVSAVFLSLSVSPVQVQRLHRRRAAAVRVLAEVKGQAGSGGVGG